MVRMSSFSPDDTASFDTNEDLRDLNTYIGSSMHSEMAEMPICKDSEHGNQTASLELWALDTSWTEEDFRIFHRHLSSSSDNGKEVLVNLDTVQIEYIKSSVSEF